MADLITLAYAQANLTLSVADTARLPAAIASASALARNHTGRYLSRRPSQDGTLGPIDELFTPEIRGPIILSEYPINEVFRVSSSRQTAFTATNTDSTTNQRAVCRLTRSGDEIAGYITTGLYIERWHSGAKTATTILLSALAQPPTMAGLATALNAQGGGWQGTAATAFALWPAGELRPGQGALGALGEDADFQIWADDLNVERNDKAGILTIVGDDEDIFNSTRWGPMAGLSYGDDEVRTQLDGIRVVYDAGYDPIPDDLQQAIAELTLATIQRKAVNSTIVSEKTGRWEIEYRDILQAMPQWVLDTLTYYRSHAG